MANALQNLTVAIKLPAEAYVGLNRNNDLIFAQDFAPGLSTKVNLGRCTKKHLEELKGYLDRLAVHAVE